jgi:hypothetical protein
MNPNTFDWHSFVPAIVGGLITGSFAISAQFFATSQTFKNNARLARNQSQKRINATLQAIRYEFEIGYDIFHRKAGKHLETLPDGQACMVRFSVPDQWLIVYPNQTEIVGQIDDKDLCKAIIYAYNEANYVLDGMKINNWYLDQLMERQKANMTTLHYEQHLRDYSPKLKIGNQKLKEQRDNLFVKIDKYLECHQI